MMQKNDLNLKKEKLPKEFLWLLLSLIISCAIMYFFVKPEYEDYKIEKLVIEIKNENIGMRELMYNRVKNITKKEYSEKEKSNIQKIKKLIYNRDDYEGYLMNMISMAENQNVIVENFTVSDSDLSKKGDFNVKNIQFTLKGEYNDLMTYLEKIENNIPLIQVNSLSISLVSGSIEENEKSPDLFNVNLQTSFYYHENEN